jgi:hypothetical protein
VLPARGPRPAPAHPPHAPPRPLCVLRGRMCPDDPSGPCNQDTAAGVRRRLTHRSGSVRSVPRGAGLGRRGFSCPHTCHPWPPLTVADGHESAPHGRHDLQRVPDGDDVRVRATEATSPLCRPSRASGLVYPPGHDRRTVNANWSPSASVGPSAFPSRPCASTWPARAPTSPHEGPATKATVSRRRRAQHRLSQGGRP